MGSTKEHVNSPQAPPPTGPYSHVVVADNLLYVSGVMGLDSESGEFVCGGAGEEFREALRNLAYILSEFGSCYDNIVKVTIILNNIKDLCVVNGIYKEVFTNELPARTLYQAKLPMRASVEIEVVALCGG